LGPTAGKKSPAKESDFCVETIDWNQRQIETGWTAAAARDHCQNNDNNGSFVRQSFLQSK